MSAEHPPSPDFFFERLVASARARGAYVSSKVARGSVPPLDVPGLVARAPVAELEQLIRMPAELQLSMSKVKEQAPELAATVGGLDVRIECPLVVAFVADRLADLEGRGWCRQCPEDGAEVLDLFLGMQLSEDFSNMPHLSLLRDAPRRLMLPSPEVHNADWNQAALREAHAAVLEAAPACRRISLARFVQAYLLLLTRTFDRAGSTRHCLVPVADMMNHSFAPNAYWTFSEEGDFVVKAVKPVQAGEELLISYGREKSNVRLYRTYGFTVPPALEPCCSVRVWPSMAREAYRAYLPKAAWRTSLDLETGRVDATTRFALEACVSRGTEPVAFLRAICRRFLARLEGDALLAAPLARLRARRASSPTSAVWWAEAAAGEASEADGAEAADTADEAEEVGGAEVPGMDPPDPWLRRCAVRVKMSEYLCLAAHLEALELEEGARPEEECLAASAPLREHLSEVLRQLRPAGAHADTG